jgi:putative peptidoglycan lipid II flippase
MSVRSISTLTIINAGLAVVGLATSVAMAWLFGTSSSIQIFFAASSLTTILVKLFQVGQISDMFLPEFVRQRELHGDSIADRCFSVLLNHVLVGVAALSCILLLCAPILASWIAPGFTKVQQGQVAIVFQMLMPTLGFIVLSGFFQAMANARGWYGRFEAYTLWGAIAGLIVLVATARWLGLWSLVLSQLITQGLSFIQRWKCLKTQGYRHAWRWREPGFDLRRIATQLYATTLYVLTMQWYTFAFTAALTLLPGEALAVYKYAESLYIRTSSLFMRPVSVVFFTDAATLAHRDPANLRNRLRAALYQYAVIYSILAVALFPALPNLLSALWGGAHYNIYQIGQTVDYAWCLFGLLLVEGSGLVYRKLNFVCGDMRHQYIAMSLVQVISAIIAAPLILRLGTRGAAGMLALNAVGFWLCGAGLLWYRRRSLWAFFPKPTLKVLLSAAGSLAVTLSLSHWLQMFAYGGSFSAVGRLRDLYLTGVLAAIGVAIAITCARFLGVAGVTREAAGRLRVRLLGG